MVTALLALNFSLMIAVPIFLARWIARRRQARWGLFGVGAVAFVLSQVGHLPFNWLVLQQLGWVNASNLIVYAAFLGLSAGTFEGIARYLVLRFWAKDARTWGKGLMVGTGHGGIEAILLGVLGLINFAILFIQGITTITFNAGRHPNHHVTQMVLRDQVERKIVFQNFNIRIPVGLFHQRALHFPAGQVFVV